MHYDFAYYEIKNQNPNVIFFELKLYILQRNFDFTKFDLRNL